METYISSTSGCLAIYRKTIVGFIILIGGLLSLYYGFGTAVEDGLYGLMFAVFIILFWCAWLRNLVLKNKSKSSWLAAHYYFQYNSLFKSTVLITLLEPLAFGIYFMDLGWPQGRVWCIALFPVVLYFLWVVFRLLRGFSRALDGMYPTRELRESFVQKR